MSLLLQALQRAQQEAAQAPEPVAAGTTDVPVPPADAASVPKGISPAQPEDAAPSAAPAAAAPAEVPPLEWQLVLPDTPLAPTAPASASVLSRACDDASPSPQKPLPEAAPAADPETLAPTEPAAAAASAAASQDAQSPPAALHELPLPQDTAADRARPSERAAAAAPQPPPAPVSSSPAPSASATSAAATASSASAPTEEPPSVTVPPAAEAPPHVQAQRRVALWPRAQSGAGARSRRLIAVLMGLLIVVGAAAAALWGWEMWFSDADLRIAQLPQAEYTPSEATAPDVVPDQSTAPANMVDDKPSAAPPATPPSTAASAPSAASRAAKSARRTAQAPAPRRGKKFAAVDAEKGATVAAPAQTAKSPANNAALQLSAFNPAQQARAAAAAGDWAVAERAWADVLQQQPRSLEAWLGRAYALFQLQQYEAALESYQRALSIDPHSAAARQGWWAVLARANPAQAQVALEAWLDEHPNDAAAWRTLGNASARLRRWADALHAWQRSAAIDPQVADVWVNIAIALDQLRRYDEAQLAYQRALQQPLPLATRQQIQQRLAALVDARQRLADEVSND